MSFLDKINDEIKVAMKAREQNRLLALRAVKSELLLAATKEGSTGEVSDEDGLKIIQKLVKQRKDTAAVYVQNGRQDLADKELEELSFIEPFLPQQLTAEEIEAAVRAIVAQVGATSVKEMGKVMGAASKELAGKADNKLVADVVKAVLSSL